MEVKPGYKQTEVGSIPDDWACLSLASEISEMTDFVAAGSFESLRNNVYVYDNPKFALYVRLFDLRVGLGHKAQKYVDEKSYKFLSKSNLFGNEILIANIGANVGDAFLMPTKMGAATIAPNMIVVRTNDKKLRFDFLHHYITSDFGQERISELIAGSGQPKINKTDLKKYKVLVPPLSEQRTIAAALSDVDKLLDSLDRLITKKRNLKQAAMQQLLTGQTRLPGFTGEWEEKRLGSVADVLKGNALSKTLIAESGVRPCILYGELFTTYGRVISNVVSRTNSSEGCRSVAGDVLLPGSTTTTGADLATASALLIDDVALGGDIIIVRLKGKSYAPVFLASLLTHTARQAIAELTQGITIHHLYGKDLKTLTVKLPSLPEQIAIAAVLSDMDAELAALEAHRDKTCFLKKGMMQELLTGRTRLI